MLTLRLKKRRRPTTDLLLSNCRDTTDLEFVEAEYRTASDSLGDFNQEMELSFLLTVSSTCTFATFMIFYALARTFFMSLSLVFFAHCWPISWVF